jgi:putative transposase
MNMECGASAPLFLGQPRLPVIREPRLAKQSGAEAPHSKWHHAPMHVLLERGVYMVTAGTYGKTHYFQTPERRDLLLDRLQLCTAERGWEIQAWAVLANHYHFIALSPDDPASLRRVLNKLHTTTAKAVNELDVTPGRKVWHEFWDTHLTFERSYLARLHYVNHNPVHHRLVPVASQYRWCSADHFERVASPSFQRTVASMPIDKVEVQDDF